ncbi:putative toxin-antitoxin system toxin component, PIN family [Rhodothermus marinus]|uniref:putative toxin-antitoxin system toxin component, PIN family n=1 Tax=Rhodothermus marinus TaxID=29549 RepID=UPI0037C6AA25
MKVFLDTNVLVSALATRGLCADLVRLVLTRHELIVAEVVLEELRRVLREKFDVSEEAVQKVEALLRGYTVVSAPEALPDLPLDANDRRVLAAAIAGDADVLVTGDRELLDLAGRVERPRILDPRGFWDLLHASEGSAEV